MMFDHNKPLTQQQKDLAAQWFPLTQWVVGKYFSGVVNQQTRETLHDAAVDGLFRATRRYDPARLSPRTNRPVIFKTFAAECIWQCCYNALHRDGINRSRLSFASLPEHIPDYHLSPVALAMENEKRAIAHREADRMLAVLPDRIRDVVRSRFVQDEPIKVISQRLNVSQQWVSKTARIGLTRLRERTVERF